MVAKPREFSRIIIMKIRQKDPASEIRPVVDPGAVKTACVDLLLPYVAERSALSPWIDERAESAKTGSVNLITLPESFATMYDQYRDSLMRWDVRDTERSIVKHADKIPSLGAVDGDEMLGAMLGMTKVAGAKRQLGLAAAGLFAPYLASAHYTLKGRQGKPLNKMQELVAKNPGKLGLATSIAALMGAKKLRI